MNKLIFDVGMHKGEDTSYYLSKGYKVVALDADPNLIAKAKDIFQNYLNNDMLVLLNYAICDKDDKEIDFFISDKTLYSSLKNQISGRMGLAQKKVKVKTKKLSSLFEEYGLPLYSKIDIEGYDLVALETLSGLGSLPKFISVETECLGEHETLTEEDALATLNALHRLGYRKFKLVDQRFLNVLKPGIVFLKKTSYVGLKIRDLNRMKLWFKFRHRFPPGSSGPFGDDLEGDWLDYETAKDNLLFHRKSYFEIPEALSFGFWCDWHAKM